MVLEGLRCVFAASLVHVDDFYLPRDLLTLSVMRLTAVTAPLGIDCWC